MAGKGGATKNRKYHVRATQCVHYKGRMIRYSNPPLEN